MDHENFRELLCLRLYGEADETERRTLDEHLSGCADCRVYALELEQGLGVLPRRRDARDDLPAGWRERLRASVPAPRRRVRISAFVAGLAAGIALAWILRVPPRALAPAATSIEASRVVEVAGLPPFVPRADAPPAATVRGPLTRLAELRRR